MTEMLYYEDSYLKEFDAEIVKIDGNKVYLDKTAFYPEGGGQPSDRGKIIGEGFELVVEDVQHVGGDVVHFVKSIHGKPKIGKVHCVIDWNRRYDFMQQHTGHHILAASIKKILSSGVFGSVIFEDLNKIEFEYDGDPRKEMKKIETLANGFVWSALPVEAKFYSKNEIQNLPLRKQPKNALEKIRIVKIGDFDLVPCGGTHVKNSSEVGIIKITSVYRKTKDIWRVEFVCGFRALKYLNNVLNDYNSARNHLNAKMFELDESISNLIEENVELKKKTEELKIEAFSSQVSKSGDLCFYIGDMEMKFMESLSLKLLEKCKVVVLASEKGYLLMAKNDVEIDIKNLMKDITEKFGGNGGGSPKLVRAGGIKDIHSALNYAVEKIKVVL